MTVGVVTIEGEAKEGAVELTVVSVEGELEKVVDVGGGDSTRFLLRMSCPSRLKASRSSTRFRFLDEGAFLFFSGSRLFTNAAALGWW